MEDVAHGRRFTIEPQADVTEVLRAIQQHQIHRLPVMMLCGPPAASSRGAAQGCWLPERVCEEWRAERPAHIGALVDVVQVVRKDMGEVVFAG